MKKIVLVFITLLFLCTSVFSADGVWSDLSATDTDDWVGNGTVRSLVVGSDGNIYIGLITGKFGVYSPTTNVWSDLSATDIYDWVGNSTVRSLVVGSDGNIYTGIDGGKFGVYNPDINFPLIRGITFNMKDSLTEANLISVNMDFNEDYYDLTDQNSPLSVDFYEGSFSATFSKEHYDSNTDFEIVVDANKSITIYLTPNSIHEITFNVKDANTNDDLAVIDMDCNVDAYDLSSQTSPFSQEFYANEGNYSCDFSTSAYDSNTGFIVVADANNTYTVYLTHEINVFSSGLGTVADPYQLFTIEDLNAVRNYPNSNFVLSNDLDFSECSSYDNCDNNIDFTTGSGWQPLGEAGTSAGCTGAHPACTDEGFICTGTQNSCETGICGSWGCTWSDASSPETYLNGSFNGNNYFINNLFINTSIVTPIGLFSQTTVDANVYDLDVTDVNIISSSGSTPMGYGLGALIGYNYGTVFNVSSTGNITTVNNGGHAGGLIGKNAGNINNSSSSVNILYGTYIGGLVYFNTGNITESYADGSITASQYIGGLVSNNSGVISNSYSRVDLNAYNNLSGFSFSGTGTIINSYSADTFTYNDTTGLSPFAGGGTDVATGSFWDSNLSGDLNTSDSNAVGKTTIEMKTESTFTDEGWDFTGIWSIDPTVNDGYPINYSTSTPAIEQVQVDFNVYETGTSTHLTGIGFDCNVDSFDLTSQTSPFSSDTNINTSASCIFSSTGYDSNTVDVVFDVNKTQVVYLDATPAVINSIVINDSVALDGVDYDLNVDISNAGTPTYKCYSGVGDGSTCTEKNWDCSLGSLTNTSGDDWSATIAGSIKDTPGTWTCLVTDGAVTDSNTISMNEIVGMSLDTISGGYSGSPNTTANAILTDGSNAFIIATHLGNVDSNLSIVGTDLNTVGDTYTIPAINQKISQTNVYGDAVGLSTNIIEGTWTKGSYSDNNTSTSYFWLDIPVVNTGSYTGTLTYNIAKSVV